MDEDDKKSLIAKRGKIKAKVTRFKTYLEGLSDESHDIIEIKMRVSNFESTLLEFEDIQAQIEDIDDQFDHDKERQEFENAYFTLRAKAERLIQNKQPTLNHPPFNQDSNSSSHQNISIRLPTINIPVFSGKFDEWLPFINTFNSVIDQNEGLNDVQKLQYLKGALKYQAAQTIENLEITAPNYAVALEVLKKQYHNTKFITQQHVRALLDLPYVQKDKPSTLRQLVTTTTAHVRALAALKLKTDTWDPIIIQLMITRLDPTTHKEWELFSSSEEFPSLQQLADYLLKRCQTLETLHTTPSNGNNNVKTPNVNKKPPPQFYKSFNKPTKTLHVVPKSTWSDCPICSQKHSVYKCTELLNASVADRVKKVKKAKLCTYCLGQNHSTEQCISKKGCFMCRGKHNTLLHDTSKQFTQSTSQENIVVNTSNLCGQNAHEVLLSTALIDIISPSGLKVTCKAFLDTGSQSSFITEALCQQLQLKKEPSPIQVTGISGTSSQVKHKVDAVLKSKNSPYQTEATLLVLPKITGFLPTQNINTAGWDIPKNIPLADPGFARPAKVDILIGQDFYLDLLENGQIKSHNMPVLQNTKLGWIVGGKCGKQKGTKITTCHLSVMDRVDLQLQKFWALDEIPTEKHLKEEDRRCEEEYSRTVRRSPDGRYIVTMPVKQEPAMLGNSRERAVKCFHQVERRYHKNPDLEKQYKAFMQEYEELGHMSRMLSSGATHTQLLTQPKYFMPHHPVIKESSTTTKLRVVFNASSKTTSGISLNDILLTGPVIQDDLFSIIIRFRTHAIVMTADIEKMYRQIWVEPSQRPLIQIVWRDNSKEPPMNYQLNTVTYGTTCAPYLATRTLQQLATDEEEKYPLAARILASDFYVDDLLTGSSSLEEAHRIQKDLIKLLASAGFNLRKWDSNCEKLLEDIPQDMAAREKEIPLDSDTTNKTLGLLWNPKDDELRFRYISNPTQSITITKRAVLSTIARLYDPLGLISPITIRGKIFMQELWQKQYGWDDELSQECKIQWLEFLNCLKMLDKINIKRGVTHPGKSELIEIHGFSDSSERAYGATIYIKHKLNNSCARTSLLCSKSKVAPLKSTSLPRLELCGALLLAKLMRSVIRALSGRFNVTQCCYWTDSSIVLDWIAREPATWKTFVANRVAKIRELSQTNQWRHVSSCDNPADLVSRGTKAIDLLGSQLWWDGPYWLANSPNEWPLPAYKNATSPPEQRTVKVAVPLFVEEKDRSADPTSNQTHKHLLSELIDRYSNISQIQRVLAYCIRFIQNCKHPNTRANGSLTPNELACSLNMLIKHDQLNWLAADVKSLLSSGHVKNNSKILKLYPFMDPHKIIRVGGRLDNAEVGADYKHPVVLHDKSRLTHLIIEAEHLRHLHAGPQLLLSIVRQRYWPTNGRNICRKIVHKCVTCFKAKPRPCQQEMGSLPKHRTTPARPFSVVGIDYCGPVYIRSSQYKKSTLMKSYICIFVCFSTKAIHLELVTDMTTEAFLGAFRRFTSRRGVSSHVYSDNGSNFLGANKELQELTRLLRSEMHQRKTEDSTSMHNIKWHFIPPNSPHFGGLWEAGVKSVKYHLRRITGNARLTYEQYYTTLTMIEACLNSRPLTPLSSHPNDPKPLTPGHFLTGDALTSLPELDLAALPTNRLSHWQRSQQLTQHFWRRWSREYLNQLQQRTKWASRVTDLRKGQLVLVKDDNLPPLKWIAAIVDEVHPGKDGRTRVASLRTSTGSMKRSVQRLCVLPIDS